MIWNIKIHRSFPVHHSICSVSSGIVCCVDFMWPLILLDQFTFSLSYCFAPFSYYSGQWPSVNWVIKWRVWTSWHPRGLRHWNSVISMISDTSQLLCLPLAHFYCPSTAEGVDPQSLLLFFTSFFLVYRDIGTTSKRKINVLMSFGVTLCFCANCSLCFVGLFTHSLQHPATLASLHVPYLSVFCHLWRASMFPRLELVLYLGLLPDLLVMTFLTSSY